MEAHPQFWLNDHLKKSPQKDKWKKFLADFTKMMAAKEIVSEDQLKQINHPVLIVQGDQDLIKIEHALQMHYLIRDSQL